MVTTKHQSPLASLSGLAQPSKGPLSLKDHEDWQTQSDATCASADSTWPDFAAEDVDVESARSSSCGVRGRGVVRWGGNTNMDMDMEHGGHGRGLATWMPDATVAGNGQM